LRQYLDLLRDVLDTGTLRPTRAKLLSTGKNIDAVTVFGRQIRYDLSEGFPLVTTKKVSFDAIVHELIWFLKGSTNIAYLKENGITIWDEWCDESGELGPIYGKQWRSWQTPDGRSIDQIALLVEGIKSVKADPAASIGRRLIVSAWNPADVPEMALPPCHTIFQFDVDGDRLSCHLLMRSCDLFLGAPYNIASYALLTHLVAHVTGLRVGDFVQTFSNTHIYANHINQVAEQLEREPLPLPVLQLDPEIADLGEIRRSQVKLLGYRSHPALRGEVAV